jgi:hypothetical protein
MEQSRMRGFAKASAAAVAVAAVALTLNACRQANETATGAAAAALGQISTLLRDEVAITESLRVEPFTEKDAGILASYLAKIRRDGVGKHADMKQRLDQLAENNTAIVTLIKVYAPQAKTPAFTTEADKFRNYASAWRDRWNSVMELFMLGGNYPASEVPFPKGFPDAVQAEIAATK